jgi:glycosyltransferase involved in cell wall biosynthesis
MKKKILIVNNNMNIGGIQKSLLNLLSVISDSYDITLLLFSDTGDYIKYIPKNVKIIKGSWGLKLLGISQSEARNLGMLSYFIRGALAFYTKVINNHFPIRVLVKTQKKISGYDYSISYMHNAKPKSFYGGCNEVVLYRTNAPRKYAYIHCDYFNYGGNTKYNRELYFEFDRIIACSEGCKRSFIRAIPQLKDKVSCVVNCQNYVEIGRNANEEPVIYNRNIMNIITVSRLTKEKGIQRIIKILPELILHDAKIHYHIIGDGIMRNKLEELAKEAKLDNFVTFHGSQANPYRYMKNADLFLLPSYHEAAPMVIEEAKCLGLPILATATTSTKEMVVNAKAGWVCENSTEGIKKALRYILEHKSELVKIKNYLLSQKYNNETALMQLNNLFNEG